MAMQATQQNLHPSSSSTGPREIAVVISRAAVRLWPELAEAQLEYMGRTARTLRSFVERVSHGEPAGDTLAALPSCPATSALLQMHEVWQRGADFADADWGLSHTRFGELQSPAVRADFDLLSQHGLEELRRQALWLSAMPDEWYEIFVATRQRLLDAGSAADVEWLDLFVNGGASINKIAAWMLDDAPVATARHDTLDFRSYAAAIAATITDPRTGTPLTVAINGPWGCGKSSLARLIEENAKASYAEGRRVRHITHWFNAWMHDDAVDMAAAFASSIAQAADSHRPLWRRMLSPLPVELLNGRRRKTRLLIRAGLMFVLITSIGAFVLQQTELTGAIKSLQLPAELFMQNSTIALLTALATIALQLMERFNSAAKTVTAFVTDPRAAAQRGSIQEVARQLRSLIHSATRPNQRFIIFVDDVERCRPPRAVDLLEVVNQLLGHARVVTVVMADLPAVAAAAEIKYKAIVDTLAAERARRGEPANPHSYGRQYLQKIIQLEFDVPNHRRHRLQDFFGEMARHREGERVARTGGRTVGSYFQVARARAQSVWRDMQDWYHGRVPGLRAWWQRRFLFAIAIPFGIYFFINNVDRLPLNQAWFYGVIVFGWYVLYQAQQNIIENSNARSEERTASILDEQIRSGEQDIARLKEAIADVITDEVDRERIVRQRLIRNVVATESDLWQAAAGEVSMYVPEYPRQAKRLVNKLRLLLSIAQDRELFKDVSVTDARMRAQAIGKWTVMWERWPELAERATKTPAALKELEQSAAETDRTKFYEALKSAFGMPIDSEDLRTFCCNEPRVSDVLDSVMHLERTATTT